MKNKLQKLYEKAINKKACRDLNEINKLIKNWKDNIENELGFTFYETCAKDIPNHRFDKRDLKIIENSSEIIVMRDKDGFYGIDDEIQQKLDEVKIELEFFHNLISRKEDLMSGNVTAKISNDELKYISEQLGYGKVREQLLEEQSRNKKVK